MVFGKEQDRLDYKLSSCCNPIPGDEVFGFVTINAVSYTHLDVYKRQVQSVVITGTNFTGATAVTFGGTAAQSFVVNNATQITAIPANAATGTVAVTTAFGTGTSVGTYTVNPSPAQPSLVTATPTSICEGSSANINATSVGNTINWYTCLLYTSRCV